MTSASRTTEPSALPAGGRPSHPPTLLRLAERAVRADHVFATGERVLVAVSGGPDSMALLHVLSRLAPVWKGSVLAHGVDHGLRPEAEGELELAASLSGRVGVPFSSTRLRVAPGPNLMARARTARYEALRRAAAAAGATVIATGHHADDRAETVLLRILRGTGLQGLGAMPPREGDRARPFLRARRADIAAHLARHGIAYAEDPSNRDPRFLRSRVRHELLPLLRALSPRIVEHLCDLADEARRGESRPESELVDVLRTAGAKLGRSQRAALERAAARKNPRAEVRLPGGAIARLDLCAGQIVLYKVPE